MPWKTLLRWSFTTVSLLGLLGLTMVVMAFHQIERITISQPTRLIEVKLGETVRDVVSYLRLPEPLVTAWSFKVWLFFNADLAAVRAGTYQIVHQQTLREALAHIASGEEYHFNVTLVEGERFVDWLERLKRLPYLEFQVAHLSESEIANQIGLNTEYLEGWLLPDTYYYTAGSTDLDLLKRAHQHMQAYLQSAWPTRKDGLPLTDPYEALVLASIIEKETGAQQERPLIASVMVNRLQRGMRLQTDPSVIYGLGAAFDGNLQRKHLIMQDNLYNTYRHKGLPPTAIAMPSKASIAAALNPAQTSYLYFVSRGDGTHYFSKSLHEHNRAVRRYILNKK